MPDGGGALGAVGPTHTPRAIIASRLFQRTSEAVLWRRWWKRAAGAQRRPRAGVGLLSSGSLL